MKGSVSLKQLRVNHYDHSYDLENMFIIFKGNVDQIPSDGNEIKFTMKVNVLQKRAKEWGKYLIFWFLYKKQSCKEKTIKKWKSTC